MAISFLSVNGFLVLHRNVSIFLSLRASICIIKDNGNCCGVRNITYSLFWKKVEERYICFLAISGITSPTDNFYSNVTEKLFVKANIFIYKYHNCFSKSITVFPVLHIRYCHPAADLFERSA